MSAKTSMRRIVHDHFDTFRDAKTNTRRPADLALHLGVPALLGGVAACLGFRFTAFGELIAAVSVLAALLFGTVVYVFQLRIQVSHDPRVEKGSRLLVLLDELFANLVYAVLAGLAVTITSVVAASFEHVVADGGLWGGVWATVLVSGSVHFVFSVLMCLKRLSSAFDELTI